MKATDLNLGVELVIVWVDEILSVSLVAALQQAMILAKTHES